MKKLLEELLLKDAFNLSQDPKNVVGIWWYQIRTGILEYSTKAKGHLDRKYFTLVDQVKLDSSIIRGRLIKYNNHIYCVSFISNIANLKTNILQDLRNKLEKESKIKIDFMIDDEGKLTEKKIN